METVYLKFSLVSMARLQRRHSEIRKLHTPVLEVGRTNL